MMSIDRRAFTPEGTTEILVAILARDPIGGAVENHRPLAMMSYRNVSETRAVLRRAPACGDISCSDMGRGERPLPELALWVCAVLNL